MRITLIENLGSGGNGTVYRGRDEDVGRDVAVKFFDNSFDSIRTQIEQHVSALRAIAHPNVVVIHGVHALRRLEAAPTDPEETALVMEYVAGKSFGAWLATPGKTVAGVRRIGLGILAGLDAFHEKSLAHGDLHAGNIRISTDGDAKLIDPMEHDPGIVRTTALNNDRRARDVRAARDLLLNAVTDLGASSAAVGVFTLDARPPSSIADLRRIFELAMSETGDPGSVIDPGRTCYSACRTALGSSNPIAWQELRKSAIKRLGTGLQELHRKRDSLPTDAADRRTTVADSLRAIDALWIMCAASVESPSPSMTLVPSDLLRILAAEWPKSGQVAFVSLPRTMFHCAVYIVGATAVCNHNTDAVVRLSHLPVSTLDDGAPTAFWGNKELCGWPRSIDENATESWKFLQSCYSLLPVLRDVFPTESDYVQALFGFNLALGICDMAEMPLSTYATKKKGDLYHVTPRVPPHWLYMTSKQFASVWAMISPTSLVSDLCAVNKLAPTDVGEVWTTWIMTLIDWWGGSRRQPFFGHSIPDWIMKTPPMPQLR